MKVPGSFHLFFSLFFSKQYNLHNCSLFISVKRVEVKKHEINEISKIFSIQVFQTAFLDKFLIEQMFNSSYSNKLCCTSFLKSLINFVQAFHSSVAYDFDLNRFVLVISINPPSFPQNLNNSTIFFQFKQT